MKDKEVKALVEMFISVIIESNRLIDQLEIKTEEQAKDKENLYKAYEKIYKELLVEKESESS